MLLSSGSRISKRGEANLLFGQILAKIYIKLKKNWIERGASLVSSPWICHSSLVKSDVEDRC